MTECNAIIEANNEIDKLERENKKLNELCVKYGFEMGRLEEENEHLKKSVSNLKDTIIKITIAYQRKYDRTIVDLVDEVHDEDITDLIKELQE